jgi:hypothetical protein
MPPNAVIPGRPEGANPESTSVTFSMAGPALVMDSGPASFARVPE